MMKKVGYPPASAAATVHFQGYIGSEKEIEMNSLQPVLDYLTAIGGADNNTQLTVEKVRSRATLLVYPENPAWIAFEIERHRGIWGTAWQKGHAMASFVTYWACYAFDPVRVRQQRYGMDPPAQVADAGPE